jgi:hypothetical protein
LPHRHQSTEEPLIAAGVQGRQAGLQQSADGDVEIVGLFQLFQEALIEARPGALDTALERGSARERFPADTVERG